MPLQTCRQAINRPDKLS